MTRYDPQHFGVTTRYDGKRVFLTTRYPKIPTSSSDIYVISTDGDFLDTLAKKYYRDPSLWWVIAQANNIKGTIRPTPGTQLRIPGKIDSILSRFRQENGA